LCKEACVLLLGVVEKLVVVDFPLKGKEFVNLIFLKRV